MHYERKRNGKDIGGAEPQRRAAGTGHISKEGYVLVSIDGRTVLEHRHLMEQLLGRTLMPRESVHHVNGDRGDNRTDGPLVNFRSGNLELWSSAQPAGQRVADKLAWAFELIRRYDSDAAAALGMDLDPDTGLPLEPEETVVHP